MTCSFTKCVFVCVCRRGSGQSFRATVPSGRVVWVFVFVLFRAAGRWRRQVRGWRSPSVWKRQQERGGGLVEISTNSNTLIYSCIFSNNHMLYNYCRMSISIHLHSTVKLIFVKSACQVLHCCHLGVQVVSSPFVVTLPHFFACGICCCEWPKLVGLLGNSIRRPHSKILIFTWSPLGRKRSTNNTGANNSDLSDSDVSGPREQPYTVQRELVDWLRLGCVIVPQ